MSREKGMLLGLAVGDALGANLEFTIFHHSEITDDKVENMSDGMWPKGAWTDDTSMSLCLGNSLIEKGGYDSYDVMEKYIAWLYDGYCSYDNQKAGDVGIATSQAINQYRIYKIVGKDEKRGRRAGNGVLMRLAPVVLAIKTEAVENVARLARISARETHFCLEAEVTTEMFAIMLKTALSATEKSEVISAVEEYRPETARETYIDILSRVLPAEDLEYQSSLEDLGGYSVDALKIAVWGFMNFDSFEEGLKAVIKLAGDTDTNGAIYGQLAGAFYGVEAIPKRWLDDLIRADEIAELAEKLSKMEKCPILRTRFEEDAEFENPA